jgi:hypothetical protein
MEHLEWHQHAFLDENNKVISVSVFQEDSHNHQLLEDVRVLLNALKIVCCCKFGIPKIGDSWDEESESWVEVN